MNQHAAQQDVWTGRKRCSRTLAYPGAGPGHRPGRRCQVARALCQEFSCGPEGAKLLTEVAETAVVEHQRCSMTRSCRTLPPTPRRCSTPRRPSPRPARAAEAMIAARPIPAAAGRHEQHAGQGVLRPVDPRDPASGRDRAGRGRQVDQDRLLSRIAPRRQRTSAEIPTVGRRTVSFPPRLRPGSRASAQRNIETELVINMSKQRKTVQTLDGNDCRWPIGDPSTRDFAFLRRAAVLGRSYCERHARAGHPAARRAIRSRNRKHYRADPSRGLRRRLALGRSP